MLRYVTIRYVVKLRLMCIFRSRQPRCCLCRSTILIIHGLVSFPSFHSSYSNSENESHHLWSICVCCCRHWRCTSFCLPYFSHSIHRHIYKIIFNHVFLCHFADEMLESEKSSLFGRVHDLERRVLTQQDEIVCLRSTLADVLRRLNSIEGNIERGAITNSSLNIQGGRSAPNTPSRNGAPVFNRCKYFNYFQLCETNLNE